MEIFFLSLGMTLSTTYILTLIRLLVDAIIFYKSWKDWESLVEIILYILAMITFIWLDCIGISYLIRAT